MEPARQPFQRPATSGPDVRRTLRVFIFHKSGQGRDSAQDKGQSRLHIGELCARGNYWGVTSRALYSTSGLRLMFSGRYSCHIALTLTLTLTLSRSTWEPTDYPRTWYLESGTWNMAILPGARASGPHLHPGRERGGEPRFGRIHSFLKWERALY